MKKITLSLLIESYPCLSVGGADESPISLLNTLYSNLFIVVFQYKEFVIQILILKFSKNFFKIFQIFTISFITFKKLN